MASKRRVPPAPPVSPASPVSPFWTWLRDDTNRNILAWLGSGLVALASGFWVLYQYPEKDKEPAAPKSTATPAPQDAGLAIQVVVGGDLTAGKDLNIGSTVSESANTAPEKP
jgi:hypothetical protein